jgi:hypothetical protein
MNPSRNASNTLTPAQECLLDEHLGTLRAATQSIEAPVHLEARLMTAFATHHARQKAKQRRRNFIAHWFAPGFALAASVGMSAWMMMVPMAGSVSDDAALTPGDANAPLFAGTPFIALQSLEQIALEPRPRVIQTSVPRMMLASYGVPVNPQSAGESIRAEMLVSASGQALAMRFVP